MQPRNFSVQLRAPAAACWCMHQQVIGYIWAQTPVILGAYARASFPLLGGPNFTPRLQLYRTPTAFPTMLPCCSGAAAAAARVVSGPSAQQILTSLTNDTGVLTSQQHLQLSNVRGDRVKVSVSLVRKQQTITFIPIINLLFNPDTQSSHIEPIIAARQ